ncbi:MAG: tyrosine-type recombinase/integrase, partial [Chloroflexota bacterium]
MSDLIPPHLTWLQAGGRAARTIHARERLLYHANEALPYGLDNAHPDEISYYLADPDWATWTRHTYHGHLVGYYRWAWAARYLSSNPMAELLRPPEGDRIPNPVTTEELAAALDRLPRQPWRMAVLLAAYAGLRCCEIVAVRREHCTPTLLRVVGKGGRKRAVSMSLVLWAEIQDLPPGLLCVGARGQALTAQMLTQMQGPIWQRIGLNPSVHMHRFRHWFATSLLESGATLPEVQVLMGHASITSTVGYTQVVDSRRLAA